MAIGVVEVEGKSYYQSGAYRVEAYPELTNEVEAIKLLINARDTFFGLAQDGIGIPPYIFNEDKSGYLHDRREVVETVFEGRKKLLAEMKAHGSPEEVRSATAKYVGAVVELLGVLGEEMVALTYQHNRDQELQALRGQMEPLLLEAYDLLPNVRLKGNITDMDGVLRAQLGETVKAAITPTNLDFVHKGDYGKIIGAMQDVTAISQWMDEQLPKTPQFDEIRATLADYSAKVQARLGVRREDENPAEMSGGIPRRDRMEVEIEGLKDRLVGMLDDAQGQRTRLSGHIRRGTDLMYDMIKQGEKPVSTYLVFAIRHAEQIGTGMKLLVTKSAPLKELREPIAALVEAAGTHLRKGLRDGSYRDCRQADLAKAKAELVDAIDHITIPPMLPSAQAEATAKSLAHLKKGLDLLEHTLPDLEAIAKSTSGSEMGRVRRLRKESGANVSEWQQEALTLSYSMHRA